MNFYLLFDELKGTVVIILSESPLKARNLLVIFPENPQMKINSFQKQTHDIYFILDQTKFLKVPL